MLYWSTALIDWQANQSKNPVDIYEMQRTDWEYDLPAEREAEKAAHERVQQEIKNRREKQKADEKSYSKLKNQYDWNKLMKKAALIQAVGRLGTRLTSANDYELKRLRKWNHQICFTACAKAQTVFISDFIPESCSGIKVAKEIDDHQQTDGTTNGIQIS